MLEKRLVRALHCTTRIGEITIENTQDIPVDEKLLRKWMHVLLQGVRCHEFDVGIWLAKEDEVRNLNLSFRNINASTDILSFPFHDEATPGEVPDAVPRDDEDLLNLGDMIVDVSYVQQRMLEDKADADKGLQLVDDTDKGVSRAMAFTFDLDRRIRMLLIHGVCHLLMYDHETDEDFNTMAALEDNLLTRLTSFEKEERLE
eukprot:CAMPEP_0197324636 /NCGR_PEP_ID=MMETSP0891-20130614/71215_1 /TAXON_ID=44058 ORGANISM="Aureoumbra lagunensis, Strain CCMP1510" /NCGR_SAMPLE_ID=MMETSP0891 /ASSEMBLY_ACC=CAM_ASM_000534 /LENGTH=201 /DNA_ID=CAMNT_0042817473 /DNA_START=104 /DNA_END=709 /DNA_ORIENTATION=+